MNANRRDFFTTLTTLAAAFTAGVKSMAAQSRRTNPPAGAQTAMPGMDHSQHAPALPANAAPTVMAKATTAVAPTAVEPFVPVQTPDLGRLPFKMADGVKEFNLVAEVVQTHLVPERPMTAWGYNGSVPGPTIEVQEGDRVRIIFRSEEVV